MKHKTPWFERDAKQHLAQVQALVKEAGDCVFTEVFKITDAPLIQAQEHLPLVGAMATIKANLDVAGYHTCAGSKLLGDQPATEDAEAVKRLKAAGATLIGHTNMTELAYSGVGLNPHFGTPKNPLLDDAIPGGSTSGGAVSVAKGIADIALGTDTGGSLRIPAAFCGLTGFKPSRSSVPAAGCLPLSHTLDSIGPIARNVAACRAAWEVLSEEHSDQPISLADVQFIVPTNFGLDDLDDAVKQQFDQTIASLQKAGCHIEHAMLDVFEDYKDIPVWQFSAVESRRFYDAYFDLDSAMLDSRVRKRIARGATVSDKEFERTQEQRQSLIEILQQQYTNSVFVMPTVACLPPKFSDFASDDAFDRINLLCLRNTTFANVIDGCSISLPIGTPEQPVGLMLTMLGGGDGKLLAIADRLETVLDC